MKMEDDDLLFKHNGQKTRIELRRFLNEGKGQDERLCLTIIVSYA